MSDEALNAHLDWMDKCAEEQLVTEHVHEWKFMNKKGEFGVYGIYCSNPGCEERLYEHQAEARLNATERLSAEDAHTLYHSVAQNSDEDYRRKDALFAYANILEGKNKTMNGGRG